MLKLIYTSCMHVKEWHSDYAILTFILAKNVDQALYIPVKFYVITKTKQPKHV